MLLRSIGSVVAFVLILGGLSLEAARKEATEAKVLLRIETVKPDMVAEYEDLVRTELVPALQRGGMVAQDAWTTAGVGQFFRYIYAHPVQTLATFDSPSPSEKALGPERAQRLTGKLRRCLNSVEHIVLSRVAELSGDEDDEGSPALLLVGRFQVEAGKREEFEALVKAQSAGKDQAAGERLQVYRSLVGGHASTYFLRRPLKNFGEIDNGAVNSFRNVVDEGSGIIAGVEIAVFRHVRGLSFSK
jgi:hypothetical protein